MTLLFLDGFQDAAAMPKPEWDVLDVFVSVTGRDGTATSGARMSSNTSARTATLPSPAATCIAGIAFQFTNSAVLGNVNMTVLNFIRSGTPELTLTVNTGGMLEVRRYGGTLASHASGTLLGTSSGHAPLIINVWRHVAMKAILATGTGGSFEVRLDDVPVLTVSGVATASASGSVTAVRVAAATLNGTSMNWDDLYVMDGIDGTATDGRPNNDFVGDLKIATLLPTAAGDSAGWTPSAGANWDTVNENPVNTTDYVSTTTAAARDLYAHADLPAGAVSVLGIRSGLYAAKTDAGAATIKHVLKEGGVVTVGSGKPLSVTYTGYWGDLVKLKPSGAAVFTVADVNALQAGVELA